MARSSCCRWCPRRPPAVSAARGAHVRCGTTAPPGRPRTRRPAVRVRAHRRALRRVVPRVRLQARGGAVPRARRLAPPRATARARRGRGNRDHWGSGFCARFPDSEVVAFDIDRQMLGRPGTERATARRGSTPSDRRPRRSPRSRRPDADRQRAGAGARRAQLRCGAGGRGARARAARRVDRGASRACSGPAACS